MVEKSTDLPLSPCPKQKKITCSFVLPVIEYPKALCTYAISSESPSNISCTNLSQRGHSAPTSYATLVHIVTLSSGFPARNSPVERSTIPFLQDNSIGLLSQLSPASAIGRTFFARPTAASTLTLLSLWIAHLAAACLCALSEISFASINLCFAAFIASL